MSVVVLCATLSSGAGAKKRHHHRSGASSAARTPAHSAARQPHAAGSPAKARPTAYRRRRAGARGARRSRARTTTRYGQHAIQNERAREIQEALIREKYLDGEPSGSWDQRTKDAMTRFQNDNGWQTKAVPDARALIKLGLGPKHTDVLNPEALANPVTLPDGARGIQPAGAGTQR